MEDLQENVHVRILFSIYYIYIDTYLKQPVIDIVPHPCLELLLPSPVKFSFSYHDFPEALQSEPDTIDSIHCPRRHL
jgi:hypothetical protein